MSQLPGRPRPGYRLGGLPIHLQVSADLGARAIERGEFARGLREIDRALLEAPEHPELLRLRALGLMLQGEVAQALECYHEAAERWPEDALIACQLGAALAQNGDMAAAEDAFRRAIAQDPLLIDGWYNLGHALDARADTAGACAAFAQVLQLQPDHVGARVQHAEMLKMLGRLDEAERDLRRVLAREPDSVAAWVGLSNLKTFRPDAAELETLLRLQAGGTAPEHLRIDLAFACGALLEQRGRYAEAFALFELANAGKRKQVRWDAPAVSAWVDRILAHFSRLSPPRDEDGARGSEVIFLVGMPRSGSSLVEQILSSHPCVQGGGERNEIAQLLQAESRRRRSTFPEWVDAATDEDWVRLGEGYLARCASWRDARPRCTDKTLANWQTLGAIRRMLPGARFVHCRRDPVETLWSCYKHHFAAAQFFTYDMDELVSFWRDCERAMAAWSQAWPQWIHALVHEQLLAHPELRIRQLLADCALEFDPACLSFHANPREVRTSSASQVREPLRRDLAVAHRYGTLLDSLRRSMESGSFSPTPDSARH